MKNIALVIILIITSLSGIGQKPDIENNKSISEISINEFIYSSVYRDTIVHLIWENTPLAEIVRVQVERSFDDSTFTALDSAYVNSLPDLQAENYNPSINRFKNILKSSEHGNMRFLYNDIIPGIDISKGVWYRILMYSVDGKVYISPVTKSNNKVGLQKQQSELLGEFAKKPLSIAKVVCPLVGIVPVGYVQCGSGVTYYGDCCYWVETPYSATSAVQTNCGGSSYAWCCNNVPESASCIASGACFGFASDPCCVHYCDEYVACTCQPWQCCPSSEVQQNVVTEAVIYNGFTLTGNVQNVNCSGLNTGSITTVVTNAIPPVTYLWSNNSTTQNLINIPAGNYTVTATDAANCSYTSTFNVAPYTPVNLTTTSSMEHCGHSDGTALVTATGGSGNYTYLWNTNPAQTSPNIINLSGGNYSVTVSDGMCGVTTMVSITNLPAPVVTALVSSNETCTAGNGSATTTVTGGTPAYSYHWSSVPGQYTSTLQNVHAGNYIVTVTDANNCIATTSISIVNYPPPILTVSNINPSNCAPASGSITISVNGGAFPYYYLWNTVPPQHTPTAAGLPQGTYTVTVTDINSCSASASATITYNPAITLSTSFTPEHCGHSDGSASVNVTGGNGNFTYQWNTIPVQTSANATNLSSGNYTVTVSDGVCNATSSLTVNNLPGPSVSILSIVNETCSAGNGSITALASGGTGVYTYIWNSLPAQYSATLQNVHAGTYSLTVTDINLCTAVNSVTISNSPPPVLTVSSINPSNCAPASGSVSIGVTGGAYPYLYLWNTIPPQYTPTAVGLSQGTYTVTVTDANNCTASISTTITSNPPIILSPSFTPEHCSRSDGSASVNVTGGNGQFSYQWNTIPVQTSAIATNLSAGIYTVTVTDGVCSATSTFSINNLSGPSVSIQNIVNETCSSGNGSATALVSGGTGVCTYLWSSSPTQYSPTLQNVHAGSYTVTVTDAYYCTAINSVTITNTPSPVLALANMTPANCGYQNGSISVNTTGGAPPYQYVWNTIPPQYSQTASGIPYGYFMVTVTDMNNCQVVFTGHVSQIPGPTATASGQPEICSRGNGSATVYASGGYSNYYTYIWSTKPEQYTQSVSNLSAGIYIVTVSDGGCIDSDKATVLNTPGPTAGFYIHPKILTIMDDPVSFMDESIGNVIYWQWDLGDGSSETITQFYHKYENVGKFTVTLIVTDNNQCKDTITDIVIVKDVFEVFIPNSFTPNGDGVNDFFFPQGINWDPDNFEMLIFDRWGNRVYKATSISDKWNGTLNNQGTMDDVVIDVYVYLIRIKELDGGPRHVYVGKVALIK
jgi:gliding motility-associated-like protein